MTNHELEALKNRWTLYAKGNCCCNQKPNLLNGEFNINEYICDIGQVLVGVPVEDI